MCGPMRESHALAGHRLIPESSAIRRDNSAQGSRSVRFLSMTTADLSRAPEKPAASQKFHIGTKRQRTRRRHMRYYALLPGQVTEILLVQQAKLPGASSVGCRDNAIRRRIVL